MSVDYGTLNENQLRAVEWQEGALLALAGPGSGKTRVLTYRIARLVQSTAEKRFKILGLTFTNKAAAEMRERIDQLVPDAASRTLLTTFHSFCADLLRQHGHHVGLRPDFTILGQQEDRVAVLEEAIDRASAGDDYTAEQLLPMIERMLDLNVPPDRAGETLRRTAGSDWKRLSVVYGLYRQTLIEKNRLDFGALIAETVSLLESVSAVTKQIRRIYPYVCVDEFQDTNYSQYRVLRQLVNPETRNLFVVADDDQIIYQWNGADPERLEQLRTEFDMTVIQLPENYRCPAEVIDVANKLIQYNLGRAADKELLKAHKHPTRDRCIRVRAFDSLDEEAVWVAQDIASRESEDQAKCAVLTRTRKVLDVFVRALEGAGVPAFVSIRKDEFTSAQMRWLHAMLRLANARQDREQLRRVCKAFYSLEGININVRDVVSTAATASGDYLRAWRVTVLDREELSAQCRAFIGDQVAALTDRLDFRVFINAAFGWFDAIEADQVLDGDELDGEYAQERAVWNELNNDIVRQYGAENITLHLLLQELDLRSKTPVPRPGDVPCFTIHASKGMEFGHVYIVGMVEDQLPSWAAVKKGDDSQEMQEERRNCFVAVTRAQDSLILSFSAEVFGWSKRPSRFLEEMELI
jgi:DNA helicase-2/ATP-dependent DNA helicase PcrA